MQSRTHFHSRRRGQSLIGLLAVVFILIAVYVMFFSGGKPIAGGNSSTKSLPKMAIEKGESTAMSSNIRQIQMAINMYKSDNDGKAPATLEEAKAVAKCPDEMWINPIDKKPLLYDPATGTVSVDTGGGPAQAPAAQAPAAQAPAAQEPAAQAPASQAPGGVKIPAMEAPAVPSDPTN